MPCLVGMASMVIIMLIYMQLEMDKTAAFRLISHSQSVISVLSIVDNLCVYKHQASCTAVYYNYASEAQGPC